MRLGPDTCRISGNKKSCFPNLVTSGISWKDFAWISCHFNFIHLINIYLVIFHARNCSSKQNKVPALMELKFSLGRSTINQ